MRCGKWQKKKKVFLIFSRDIISFFFLFIASFFRTGSYLSPCNYESIYLYYNSSCLCNPSLYVSFFFFVLENFFQTVVPFPWWWCVHFFFFSCLPGGELWYRVLEVDSISSRLSFLRSNQDSGRGGKGAHWGDLSVVYIDVTALYFGAFKGTVLVVKCTVFAKFPFCISRRFIFLNVIHRPLERLKTFVGVLLFFIG